MYCNCPPQQQKTDDKTMHLSEQFMTWLKCSSIGSPTPFELDTTPIAANTPRLTGSAAIFCFIKNAIPQPWVMRSFEPLFLTLLPIAMSSHLHKIERSVPSYFTIAKFYIRMLSPF